MRFGIIGLVAFIGAYVASILLYVNGGMGHPHQIADTSVAGDGAKPMRSNRIEWNCTDRKAPWRSASSCSVFSSRLPAWPCSSRFRRCVAGENSSRR